MGCLRHNWKPYLCFRDLGDDGVIGRYHMDGKSPDDHKYCDRCQTVKSYPRVRKPMPGRRAFHDPYFYNPAVAVRHNDYPGRIFLPAITNVSTGNTPYTFHPNNLTGDAQRDEVWLKAYDKEREKLVRMDMEAFQEREAELLRDNAHPFLNTPSFESTLPSDNEDPIAHQAGVDAVKRWRQRREQ